MVLSEKFTDPSILTNSLKITVKPFPMDSGLKMIRGIKLSGSETNSKTNLRSGINRSTEEMILSRVQGTARQKGRTSEWPIRVTQGASKGGVSNPIASRGELSRRETTKLSTRTKNLQDTKLADQGRYRNGLRTIQKSASVPTTLKEVVPVEKIRRPEEGILKKSSAFLASLVQATRISDRKPVETFKYPIGFADDYSSYLSILNDSDALRKSRQALDRKTRVKKSVSFSSDTSFEEKRAPFRRVAVHEVKVYHKGVLQDRDAFENKIRKVPPSWETPSGGRLGLLRAARDADDAVLNEIVTKAHKYGLGDMDVNITDSSGRTAISYMAGNGTSAMLELALSFDGADPNIPDNEGNTPLHFAAQAGQTECLNILLQRCPDIEVDARNSSGFTPLMKAALQGRTKCAKILLFAGANPTLRDHGRGLRAEQWARFCGRYVCAEVIERFARHRLLERSTSCRWGSEPELAAKVLQGKVMPIPMTPLSPPSSGLKSKIRRVFRTTSGPDRNFSLVSQLTSAALCASSPALPKSGDIPPVVKSLLRPLSVPQLRVTLVSPHDFLEKTAEKYGSSFTEKIENTVVKPPRSKKKNK